MTLTKAHFIDRLFAQNMFTKTESAHIIETLFQLMKQTLEDGEDVLISSFGRFQVRKKSQRTGRNPQTGKLLTLPSRRVVTFKCSAVLRERMNKTEVQKTTPVVRTR